MVLPLYLAMTAAEISGSIPIPDYCAYMACQFSPYTEGLTNLPESMPEETMLVLNDRMPYPGHSADLVVHQLQRLVDQWNCESILLDFQRPPDPESMWLARKIADSLLVPVAATEGFARDLSCPVLLSPAPLHVPLPEYLQPWHGREIWLEAGFSQEEIIISKTGAKITNRFPPDGLSGGFFDKELCCHYQIKQETARTIFTLFDTPTSLREKLELAHSLGVVRAVGIYQELGYSLK